MNSKKFTILILILLIIDLFSGCNYENNHKINLDDTNFMNKVNINSDNNILPFAKSGGINIGLYNNNGEIEKDSNFIIKDNEKISKYISIGNMIDEERVYKLLLFVDYKQENFSVDGRNKKTDFTFKLNPNQSIMIPVTIQPLVKGIHDILFIIVKDPYNKSLDKNYRKQTDMSNLLFLRFSVVVDKEVNKQITFNKYGDIKNDDILDGVFISKDSDYKRWLTQNVSMNDDILNYYIHIGNNRNEGTKQYALIVLYDWKQISILDSTDAAAFFKLKNNQTITLNTNLKVGEKSGIYNLSVILIHNPFEKCTMENREVETGIRVGINVK